MMQNKLKIGGYFRIRCYNQEGKLKWNEDIKNVVTDEGINHLLNVGFHGVAATNPWYVLLAESGAKAITDTLASHAAWLEVTGYTGDRPEFVEGAAAAKSISNNGNNAVFAITGPAMVGGAGLASVATGDIGILFNVSDFASPKSVDNGDSIEIEYTLNCADA